MKKNDRSIKKVIKNRIELQQGKKHSPNKKVVKKQESKMNERHKLRIGGTPPPSKHMPVGLVGRSAIRTGETIKHKTVMNNLNTFQMLLEKLEKNEPFSFLRFGDADYVMMDKSSVGKIVGKNNKMMVTNKLNREIIESHQIKDSNYIIGTVLYPDNKNILHNYNVFLNSQYKKFLTYDISFDNMTSAVALTETYMTNITLFSKLVQHLKKTNTMFVGSYNHSNLDYVYGKIVNFIKTPPYNSYSDIDRIYNEIIFNINGVDKIIFSCGQIARIIIKRLWIAGYDKKILIDVGSLSDYFVLNTKLENQIQLRLHITKHKKQIKNNYNKLIETINEDSLIY